MKIKNIIKACTFVLIIVILSALTGKFAARFDEKKDVTEKYKFLVADTPANRIVMERQDSIDVVFLGDSLVLAGFSPYELWEKYGFTSYICGSAGQHMYESYDYLKKVFELQSPSVVVLEVNALNRYSTVEQYALLGMADKIEILGNHDNWKSAVSSLQGEGYNGAYNYSYQQESDAVKGYVFQRNVVPAKNCENYMKKSDAGSKICLTNKILLKQMDDLCRENNATLVLVSVPSVVNCSYERSKAVAALARDMKLDLVDYNIGEEKEKLALDWNVDTRDAGDHLSYSGMIKMCDLYGSYLSDKYSLQDRRNEAEYNDWNEGLKVYHSLVD